MNMYTCVQICRHTSIKTVQLLVDNLVS